jgi:hypothetical protein
MADATLFAFESPANSLQGPATKICCRCSQPRPVEDFNKNRKRRDGLQSFCRTCDNGQRRAWYRQPGMKDAEIARNREQRRAIVEWFAELKSRLKCDQCPENHPATLDFHHRNAEEKDFGLAELSRKSTNKDRILRELAKCQVLCANCHRKLHYNLKQARPCSSGVERASV